VSNITEQGKRKIPNIRETIESDLVLSCNVRGSDINRWSVDVKIFALIVQDKNDPMKGYDESL